MFNHITKILTERILILDGAMGSLLKEKNFSKEFFRGEILKDHSKKLKNNFDILSITQTQTIADIHLLYLEAGADIITTNTFMANSLDQKKYGTEHLCFDINFSAAQIAKNIIQTFRKKNPTTQKFIAGSLGPTNFSLSKNKIINFEQLEAAYSLQIKALIKGGADLIILETVYDILNCKAGISAFEKYCNVEKKEIPIIISATLNNKTGRLASGESLKIFIEQIKNTKNLLAVGLNCIPYNVSKPFITELSALNPFFLCFYPNAGLPNNYASPKKMQNCFEKLTTNFKINILGSCCGTTPLHTAAFSFMKEEK